MKSNEIGITMVGTTGTGKTCYLYAMADTMSFGVNGISFTPDYNNSLMLDEGWQNICAGTWPEPTNKTDDITFICSYATRPLVDFRWCDYKGGILTSRAELDIAERDEIIKRMQDSFCLIVCVSAEHLKGLLNVPADSSARSVFKAYQSLLQNYRKRTERTIPVVFAVTKSDLINKDEYARGVEALRNGVFSSFLMPGAGWLMAFVPVSLGRGFQMSGGKIVGGQISPWNIQIPVLFCVKCFIDGQIAELENKLKNVKNGLSTDRSVLATELSRTKLSRWLLGDEVDSRRANIADGERLQDDINKQLSVLRNDLANIGEEILRSGAKIFYDGQEAVSAK